MILLVISFCMSQFSLAAQPVHVKVQEIPPKKAQSEKPAYSPEHIRELEIKAAQGDPSAQSSWPPAMEEEMASQKIMIKRSSGLKKQLNKMTLMLISLFLLAIIKDSVAKRTCKKPSKP